MGEASESITSTLVLSEYLFYHPLKDEWQNLPQENAAKHFALRVNDFAKLTDLELTNIDIVVAAIINVVYDIAISNKTRKSYERNIILILRLLNKSNLLKYVICALLVSFIEQ